jgi:hypothetical protein
MECPMPRHTEQEKFAILARRKAVAELYLAEQPQYRIAQQLKVNVRTVKRDLALLRQQWLQAARVDFAERKARELAKLDRVEELAWEGWQRSCANRQTKTEAVEEGRVSKAGAPLPPLVKRSSTSKSQVGDPRFLEIIASCVQQRCALLGLQAQDKPAFTKPDGTEEYGTLTDDEAAAGLENLLVILGARGIGPLAAEGEVAYHRTLTQPLRSLPGGGDEAGPVAGAGDAQRPPADHDSSSQTSG